MPTSYEPSRCPACGRHDGDVVTDRERVRREVEELWEFQTRRLRPGAPLTGLVDRLIFTQPPALQITKCAGCGTLYRDPAERWTVDEYEDDPLDDAALSALAEANRRLARQQSERLTRIAGGAGKGLEVGSYTGEFLATAGGRGWAFEGVDVNERANRFARERGARVTRGTIDDVPADRTFDAIAIWNCFEQLPQPAATLRAVRERLRPGGVLAIRVPNGAFYAALRPHLNGPLAAAVRAALAHNNLLGFPYRYGFAPGALRDLLRENGFTIERRLGDSLGPVRNGWTRRWAAVEERVAGRLLRFRHLPAAAPWLEVYARLERRGRSRARRAA